MPRFPTRLPLPLLAAAVLLGPPALAQGTGQGDAAARYTACIETAHDDPAAGLERARTWQDTGGGDPARHCAGVALISLGRHAEAGRLLETLAQTMGKERGVALRAKALAQAGQAWLLAGQPARAEAVYGQALDLAPKDVELWIDRALARFDMGAYWEAIDDLNRASELAPDRADILVYRASAYRHVDAPAMARGDVRQALEIDPDHVEGLLERGNLRRLSGNKAGARRDWLKVIDLAPKSPAADSARENLARLDVKGVTPAGDDGS
jgi:tetratricopeptide (TPR) repeat protein